MKSTIVARFALTRTFFTSLCLTVPSGIGCSKSVDSEPAAPIDAVTSAPAEDAASSTPKRIYCTFGTCGGSEDPNLQPLSAAEETELLGTLAGLAAFPKYIYSGCHDRAHAVVQQLPASQRARLGKIWLFAPDRLSYDGTQTIAFPLPITEQSASWGYHVALVYENQQEQLMIVDPAISMSAMSMDVWLRNFAVPQHTYWLLTKSEQYLFYGTNWALVPDDRKSKSLFNGGFYTYEGPAKESELTPKNLARDAVGELLLSQRSCDPRVEISIEQPQSLLNWLACATGDDAFCGPSSTPAWTSATTCADTVASAIATYERQLELWRQRLGEES